MVDHDISNADNDDDDYDDLFRLGWKEQRYAKELSNTVYNISSKYKYPLILLSFQLLFDNTLQRNGY